MTDKELLALLERSAGRSAGYKQLIRELGLAGGRERRLLREQLKRLVASGHLVQVERGRWAPASGTRARGNWVSGRLEMARDGYGFVRPDDAGPGEEDVFIPPNALEGAMDGDRVMAEFQSSRDPRRPSRRVGRILRVLVRRHPTVVGIFHYAPSGRRGERWGGNFVTPLDTHIGEAIVIPPGAELPAHDPMADRIFGREAAGREKSAGKARLADLEGMVVDVAIVDWPTATRPARGRVIEVLGERDAFGVDVEILIRKHHLPHVFPDRVLKEARAVALPPPSRSSDGKNPGAPRPALSVSKGLDSEMWDTMASRRDFRHLPTVTIDGETARDFDDAVLVRDLPGGEYELQVHIADVAHYVRPGTALDAEARLRGNSVYFPDRAIPMLPLELSADVCSLRPDEDRFVLSCIMRLGPEGDALSSELCQGLIHSARRMTYTQVQSILDGDAETRKEFAPLVPEFERMVRLAKLLHARRERRGSIDFDLPEPVIQFDEQGQMRGIVASERTWAHRLIEEFMLAANESVAGWIEAAGVPSLYRIHEKPDARRVANFEEIAGRFGYSLGVGPLPVKRVELRGDRRERMRHGGGEKRMREIPEDVHVTPRMYQQLSARLAGKPEERILTYLMLRSLKQARYSEKNEGHFALATSSYTHFTSPIRRYPDLIVHRIVKALLAAGLSGARQIARSKGAPQPALSTPKGLDSEMWVRTIPHPLELDEGAPHLDSEMWDRTIPPPYELDELAAIAQETSQTERRAADAERELIEWKKVRFMRDRIGDEFAGIVVNVAKFGLFVELDEFFIEGLVPLETLPADRYRYNEYSRQIRGEAGGLHYSIGDPVRVILDRIDTMENRLLFSLADEPESGGNRPRGKATRTTGTHPRKQRNRTAKRPGRNRR